MNNYKLLIQYDGTNYAGWQVQKNSQTVQQKITDALKILTKEDIKIIGAGRTDAGVHALGQVANFHSIQNIGAKRFLNSLNALLPEDISVIAIDECQEEFHSRFDALKRSYFYLISNKKSPFYNKYSLLIKRDLDLNYLNLLSREFIGTHDFTSFARRTSERENKVCTIYDAHWKQTGGFILFYIEADRFLHGMVRAITGTLLGGETKKKEPAFIRDILSKKNREKAGMAVASKGLFLYKIKYP